MFHPGFLGDVRYSLMELPDDSDGATEATIRVMQSFAETDAASRPVRRATAEALRPGMSAREKLDAIYRWVKAHVRFRKDSENCAPTGFNRCDTAEVLIRPVDLLRMAFPSGDCDDFSMLTFAMLKAAGIRARFATLKADRHYPDTWTHVYVVAVMPDGSEVPMDTSHGPAVGWWANWALEKKVWRSPMLAGVGDTAVVPWWQSAISSGINIAGDVIRAKAGIMPAGTVIQSQGGTYVRSGAAVDYTGGTLGPAAGVSTGSSSGLLVLGALGLVLVLAMKGGRS